MSLLRFAEFQFWLSRPVKVRRPDGDKRTDPDPSARELLRGYLKRLDDAGNHYAAGQVKTAMRGPVLPAAGLHVWVWYCELSGGSRTSGMGVNPIAYQEIEAWARATGRFPTAAEVKLIKALDAAERRILSGRDDQDIPYPALKGWVDAAKLETQLG